MTEGNYLESETVKISAICYPIVGFGKEIDEEELEERDEDRELVGAGAGPSSVIRGVDEVVPVVKPEA